MEDAGQLGRCDCNAFLRPFLTGVQEQGVGSCPVIVADPPLSRPGEGGRGLHHLADIVLGAPDRLE